MPRSAIPPAFLVVTHSFLLCAVLVACLITCADAQTAQQKLWSPYWTDAKEFQSTLQLKNNLADATLDVEISAYRPSGREYHLGTVHLQPRETTTVDLNKAIRRADPADDSSKDWGNLEVKFASDDASALMGSVSVTNPHAGIAWDFRLYSVDTQLASRPLRGVFWLPNKHADGFIVIQNTSEEASATVSVELVVSGKAIKIPTFELPPEAGRKLILRDYLKGAGFGGGAAGGIEIRHAGGGSLIAHGALHDMHGFSAEVDMRRELGDGQSKTFTLRTPRAALGPADPTLGLARDVSFTPTLILHNFAGKPIATNLVLANSGSASPAPRSASYLLAAGETKLINLARFFSSPKSSWISAELTFESTTNHVGAELVSVSQDGNHTLRSMMNHVGGALREGWYWRIGDDHNTLLAIFNPEDHSAKADVSLDFKTGSSVNKYNLGQRIIAAHGTDIIDIGAIAASGKPDTSGRVLPKNTEGGYRVTGIRPPKRQMGNLMTEALVFDRKSKTFETYYNTCCRTNAIHTPTSLSGAVGGTGQMFVQEKDLCTQITTDVTNAAGFSSFNSAIASANPGGAANYNSAGSTTLRSSWSETRWIHIDEGCYDIPSNGDRPTGVKPTINGPTVVWWFNGKTVAGYPTQVTLTTQASGTWTITNGSANVHFSAMTGQSVTVSGTGTFSQGLNDVKITVTVNGVPSDPFSMTSKGPKLVTRSTKIDQPCAGSGQQGYDSDIKYVLRDNFNGIMGGVPVNENFAGSTVWPRPTSVGGASDATGVFHDVITVCASPGGLNPIPLDPQQPPLNTLVDSFSQNWCSGVNVGNPWGSACQGVRVQTGTMKRYIDHGDVTVP